LPKERIFKLIFQLGAFRWHLTCQPSRRWQDTAAGYEGEAEAGQLSRKLF